MLPRYITTPPAVFSSHPRHWNKSVVNQEFYINVQRANFLKKELSFTYIAESRGLFIMVQKSVRGLKALDDDK